MRAGSPEGGSGERVTFTQSMLAPSMLSTSKVRLCSLSVTTAPDVGMAPINSVMYPPRVSARDSSSANFSFLFNSRTRMRPGIFHTLRPV